jgi:hypothetical protein
VLSFGFWSFTVMRKPTKSNGTVINWLQ